MPSSQKHIVSGTYTIYHTEEALQLEEYKME